MGKWTGVVEKPGDLLEVNIGLDHKLEARREARKELPMAPVTAIPRRLLLFGNAAHTR
jgi:hypothetical protein